MATLKVRAAKKDNRVAFSEVNEAHPGGSVLVYGNGKEVEVGDTPAVRAAIRQERLVTTQAAPVSRQQTPPPGGTQGQPLAGLSLTAEQQQALTAAGYGDRVKLHLATDDDLIAIPTIGKATVEALRKALAAG